MLFTKQGVINNIYFTYNFFKLAAEYELMFMRKPDRALELFKTICQKLDGMPQSFFDKSLISVVKKDQETGSRPGIILIEKDGGLFTAMAENTIIADDLGTSESVFFYFTAHYALNLLLPSVLAEKNKKILEAYFNSN